MSKNYYSILGIPRTATPAEIKRAFRQRARQLHPDVNPSPDATARFQELNAAYHLLINPLRRARYDRTGSAARRAYRPPSPRPAPVRPSPPAHRPTPASAFPRSPGLTWFVLSYFVIPLGPPAVLLYLGQADHSLWLTQIGLILLTLMLAGGEIVTGVLLTEVVEPRLRRAASKRGRANSPRGG